MKKHKKVQYADGTIYDISGYSVSENLISLHYPEAAENFGGFSIINESGDIIKDCYDFVYRWDMVDRQEGVIWYTNDPEYRQTAPWPDLSGVPDQEEPLSNEELTEAVADLMYEVSALQLGL